MRCDAVAGRRLRESGDPKRGTTRERECRSETCQSPKRTKNEERRTKTTTEAKTSPLLGGATCPRRAEANPSGRMAGRLRFLQLWQGHRAAMTLRQGAKATRGGQKTQSREEESNHRLPGFNRPLCHLSYRGRVLRPPLVGAGASPSLASSARPRVIGYSCPWVWLLSGIAALRRSSCARHGARVSPVLGTGVEPASVGS